MECMMSSTDLITSMEKKDSCFALIGVYGSVRLYNVFSS